MNKVDIDGYFFFDADKMPPAPVIIEVGAYSDHAARPLYRLYPNGRLLIIEASPNCYKRLKSSVRDIPNVSIFNFALASVDGTVEINEYAIGSDANSIFDRRSEGLVPSNSPPVIGMTLQSFMGSVSVVTVDLLLLNCEGAEVYALQQLIENETLRKRVGQVSLSFHCDHVKIYAPSVRDELLRRIGEYYEIIRGNDAVGYYLMVRK